MTIREHVKLVTNCALYGILAVIIALILAWRWWHLNTLQLFSPLLLVGGMPTVAVIYFIFTSGNRCPRCHVNFLQLRDEQLGRRNAKPPVWELWNACPRCHVSFEERWK